MVMKPAADAMITNTIKTSTNENPAFADQLIWDRPLASTIGFIVLHVVLSQKLTQNALRHLIECVEHVLSANAIPGKPP
jgi:hypothetical protein